MSNDKPKFCPFCKESKVQRFGIIANLTGKKQRFKCSECGRTFYNE